MTRIIAGQFGGRRIAAPSGRDTRPTTDRVREALFGALGPLDGLTFLDLYAGSGAIGLEAASRGASRVLLVESDARTAGVARANIGALGAAGQVTLLTGQVERVLRRPPPDSFDVIFADPPYALAEADLTEALAALVAGGWLADGAQVVIERSSRSPEPGWVPEVTGQRGRRYGETILWYGSAS